jgi:hypothetical protein
MKNNAENFQSVVQGLYLAVVGTGITYAVITLFSGNGKTASDITQVAAYLIFAYMPTVFRFSLGTANLLSHKKGKNGLYITLLAFWFLCTAVLFLASLLCYINNLVQYFYGILLIAFILDFIILIFPEEEKNLVSRLYKIAYFWRFYRPSYIIQWTKSTLILIFITFFGLVYSPEIPMWLMTIALGLASFCDFFYNNNYYMGNENMKRVIVESPYAGDVEGNTLFLKKCLTDCLDKGESPYASHLFFTQFLDDNKKEERELGIVAGFAWNDVAEAVIVYVDKGISSGMQRGVESAIAKKKPIILRRLSTNAEKNFDINKDLSTEAGNL